MEIFMTDSQLVKFDVNPAFKGFTGIFGGLKYETTYQPYGGIPKTRNENSPLKNSAQVGLRLVTDFSDNNVLCVKFISETKCLIDFDNPENEEEIFLAVAEKALVDHRNLFDTELKKMKLSHNDFAVLRDGEKKKISDVMIEHFRSLF